MPKCVHKFATGQPVPDGAVYCATVTQTSVRVETPIVAPMPCSSVTWEPSWLVWHYFLVEVSP